MYCSVSVYQLVRSSVIVFCALFNVTLLGKTVRKYMWFGILLIMVRKTTHASLSVLCLLCCALTLLPHARPFRLLTLLSTLKLFLQTLVS